MTFNRKLAQALRNTSKARKEKMIGVSKKHKFSLAYKLWEYKTLKNLKKNQYNKRWTLRRARYAAAVIIAAASLLLGTTVYAVGIMIGRYSFDTKPNYSELFIENLYSDKKSIEECYGLPEENGWRIVYSYSDETQTLINYECGDKKITFSQRVIHGNMSSVNTENSVVEPISIYVENDGFFIDHGEGICSLYWIYDGYLFDIGGNMSKNDALNLVCSTKIVDF